MGGKGEGASEGVVGGKGEGASEGVVGGRGGKVLVRVWWEVGEGRC